MAPTNGLRTVAPNKLDGWIAETLQPSTAFCRQVKQTVKKICDFLKEDCFETDIHVHKTVKVSTAQLGGQPVPLLPSFPLSRCSSSCPASVSPRSSRNGGRQSPCRGAVVLSGQGISLQGGSAGKGTALQNNSDADVVLFLSCFSSYQEQKQERRNILNLIESRLHACRRSLTFTVNISEPRYKGPGNTPRSLSLTLRSKETSESIEVDILPAYDALGKGRGLARGWAAA